MKKIHIAIIALIAVFGLQSVAYSASISTRVRILEGKVAKQAKLIKKQTVTNRRSQADLKTGIKEVQDLKKQLELFMKQQAANEHKKRAKGLVDKRYSYP